ncbi:MAG: hypothetical protein K940chlam7_01796 [Chlamydiae bacterium]|nr:hypothetical protein [Chlamydiota bacterium]
MMFSKRIFNLIPLLCLLGCATITQTTDQRVGVSSSPTGADVWIDGVLVGKTPLRTNLSRKEDHMVRIELLGYLPYEAKFSRSFNAMTLGNVVVGGVIGLAVDAASGAIYRLTPSEISACLQKDGSGRMSTAELETCEDCFFFVTDKPEGTWEKVGTLTPTTTKTYTR